MKILEHIAKALGEPVPSADADISEINKLVRRAARLDEVYLEKLPEHVREYLANVHIAIRAKKGVPKLPAEVKPPQVEPEKDVEEEYTAAPEHLDIDNTAEIMTISGLIGQYKDKQIQLPLFQRKFVWNKKMQQELIDSILLNVPLPDFLLAHESIKDPRVLLDGFQRTSTIGLFIDGLVTTGVRLKEAYREKKFSELPAALQNSFRNFHVVIQASRTNRENWPFVFMQRNKGGVKLNPMELRRVAFPYAFTGMLEELADHNPTWLKLFGENGHYEGLSALVRAHAMHEGYQNFSGGVNKYLDEYCETVPHHTKEELLVKKNAVNYILEMLDEGCGTLAFRVGPSKGVHLGMVDAMMHAGFIMLASDVPSLKVGAEILRKTRAAFLKDDDVQYALITSTSGRKSVQIRMDKVEKIVAELLFKAVKPVGAK